ncbi:hypothetical protein Tco_0963862 [Tanacetum coccineum]
MRRYGQYGQTSHHGQRMSGPPPQMMRGPPPAGGGPPRMPGPPPGGVRLGISPPGVFGPLRPVLEHGSGRWDEKKEDGWKERMEDWKAEFYDTIYPDMAMLDEARQPLSSKVSMSLPDGMVIVREAPEFGFSAVEMQDTSGQEHQNLHLCTSDKLYTMAFFYFEVFNTSRQDRNNMLFAYDDPGFESF